MPTSTRIDDRFLACRSSGRAALVTYVMAGDPDPETSFRILEALPAAGADIIEFGMPFTDPLADGPAIQAAGRRALKAGQTMATTLQLVRRFRATDPSTPVILMGYYNPIYQYGVQRFIDDATSVGVDGLIVGDLPAEEDHELCVPARDRGLSFIRLIPPNSLGARLPKVLQNTSGFVYYVSLTGITGTSNPDFSSAADAVSKIRACTDLPVVVGFGVKSRANAETIGRFADGVVVGTALINALEKSLHAPMSCPVEAISMLVRELADGVRSGKIDRSDAPSA